MNPYRGRALTKIVATVGPATRDPAMLAKLAETGVDVLRLNTAHGSFEEFHAIVRETRQLERQFGPIGILLDLAGPKIRLGELAEDPLHCPDEAELRFVPGTKARARDELTSSYDRLLEALQPGNRIVLADGQVQLEVQRRDPQAVYCRVVQGGWLRSRQGINLPYVALGLPAITDRDREWVRWSVHESIDFVSLSFVRSADDIHLLRKLLAEEGKRTPIIAKIEKPEALEAFERILDASDGIMVARGDLGVETDIATVPMAQKRIVHLCNVHCKPVIVATQMLDSMQRASLPTRAEATDVANAILDGADACMLSGETAVGEYPIETVRTMNRIMLATEGKDYDNLRDSRFRLLREEEPEVTPPAHPATVAIVDAARAVTRKIDAKMVVVVTRSGVTAAIRAQCRDRVPTFAVSHDVHVLRRLSLTWGIVPLADAPTNDRLVLRDHLVAWGKRNGVLQVGDRFVMISGTLLFPDALNQMLIYEVA